MSSNQAKFLLQLGGFLLFLLVLRYLFPLALPFLLGIALALAAQPIVEPLCRKLHMPRAAAAGIGVSAAFLLIALLILLVLAFLFRELKLLSGILPRLEQPLRSGIALLENWLLALSARAPASLRPVLETQITGLFSGSSALLDQAGSYILGLAGGFLSHIPDSALSLGTAVISGFMVSAKLPGIRSWLFSHLPAEKLQPGMARLKKVRKAVSGWILAQCKLAGVTFLTLTLGFILLRVPYAPLWALAAALLDALPILGTGVVLVPWSLIAFLQKNGARAIGLLALYVVVSLVRSALEPRLVGRQLGLDPLLTLAALYAGYRLWGLGGMILSPLLAVVLVQLFPGEKKNI